MHYTPNGTPQKYRSYIGFQFANPDEIKYLATGGSALPRGLHIPAGASDHEVNSSYVFKKDKLLLAMLPHMHLRGKDFRYTAHYPDGREEILLDVPRYDFNWQLRYKLVEPKVMPAGTEIKCVAHFDNSGENLSNPDPSIDVTWGDQTWEEMMIGFLTTRDIEPLDREAMAKASEEAKQKLAKMREMAVGMIAQADKNGNGTISKDEAPPALQNFFGRFDSNGDGEIDADEGIEIIKLQQGRGRGRGRR